MSLAYPGGRAPVPNVTTNRCSMPRPPRGVATDSNTSGGDDARPIMSVAAAARSRLAPASWYIDSASPRSVNASSAATTSEITACRALFSAGPKVGWPAPIGAGIGGDDGSRRLGLHLRQLPAVGDQSFRAGLRRVVDRVHLQRVLAAELEHDPVDLDPADARRIVDAPLEQVAEQRPELLAVAHALRDRERAANRRRRQAGRERGERAARRAAVRAPRGAQHSRGARLAWRRRHHEAAARRSVTVPSGMVSDAGTAVTCAALDAANGSPRADLVPALASPASRRAARWRARSPTRRNGATRSR